MPQCPVTGFCHLHTLLAATPSGQACHLAQPLPAPQASPGSGTARSAVPPFLSGDTSLLIPAPSSALAPSPHTAAPLRPCPLPLVLGNCPHQPTALWPSTAAAQSRANPAPPPCLPACQWSHQDAQPPSALSLHLVPVRTHGPLSSRHPSTPVPHPLPSRHCVWLLPCLPLLCLRSHLLT